MRIHHLHLKTNRLQEQKHFYQSVLGLEIEKEAATSFTVVIGESRITFEQSEIAAYYHFAINIPSNQIQEAKAWLEQGTELLDMDGTIVFDFSSWEAEAMYFYDAAGNILELIGRRRLGVESQEPFSADSLLHVSEMGVPLLELPSTLSFLKELGVKQYSGDKKRFAAVGGETGLFILVNRNMKKWIPKMEEALPFPFEVTIENEAGMQFDLIYENDFLEVS